MLYADARGVLRVYQMRLDEPSNDGDVIAGRWEGSHDGSVWRPDSGLTYPKP